MYISRFQFSLLIVYLLLQSPVLFAQTGQPLYSKEVEEKIARVEKGLSGWVKTTDSSWNISERMQFHKIHGVSIAVVRNYKLEWARGYGFADTSDNRPVTNQTLFQAASISKSLNAVGVLKLAETKKLELQKDINSYLRSWKFPYDTAKTHNIPITITHLLSHTAGLSVHGFPGYKWSDALPSDNDILDGKKPANTAAVRSEFVPGLKYKYSGGGTTITKKIIMDLSGQPYDRYMAKEVLQPMGMVNSSYTQPPLPGSFPYLATAYYRNGNPIVGKFHIYPEQAADGLWTNPTDLANYIIEMQLSLEGKSNKVLTKELTQTMLTPILDNSGLGAFIEAKGTRKYFGHSGGNEGFRCQYYGSMEGGDGVIVMVNSDNGAIILEILNSVAAAYNWNNFTGQTVKRPVPVHIDTLATYTGTYQLEGITLKIIQKDYTLYLVQDASPPVKMYFTSNTDFFIKEVNAESQFQKNVAGVVDTILIRQSGREFKAKRRL
ncbi:MAG: serine hydrolase [Chitinophagaceae bacterium]|nr:serine hydrolase [Chitinophagaceae bacterium]